MEIKVAKRIKVDNPLILKEEYDSRFSGQRNVITSVLQVEEEGGRIGRRGATSERLVQLDFKMEKGPITQGIQAASRSWERQGNGLSRRNSELLIPGFLGLFPSENKIINMSCFKPLSLE